MNSPIPTRRKWLAGMAAMLSMRPSLKALATWSPADNDEYIDAHVHVWTPDRKGYPRSGKDRDAQFDTLSFTPDELLANAKPSRVDRVVLVQMNFYGYDNTYMLDAIKKYHGVFRGIAVIDETAPGISQRMRELYSVGVRGFRVIPSQQSLDSPAMTTMWKRAAENSQAICVLVNPGELPALDAMCAKFPDTKVVVDHLARIGMSGPILDSDVAALRNLARRKQVYVKVSAFYALGKKQYPYIDLRDLIHQVFDAYGASRLMWGSDCPFQVEKGNTYAGSIELVKEHLDFLSANDRKWILRKTAEEVFFKA